MALSELRKADHPVYTAKKCLKIVAKQDCRENLQSIIIDSTFSLGIADKSIINVCHHSHPAFSNHNNNF